MTLPAASAPISSVHPSHPVSIVYTNWRGETRTRVVIPRELYFGTHDKHPVPQWILRAYDIAKEAERHFAMVYVRSWRVS